MGAINLGEGASLLLSPVMMETWKRRDNGKSGNHPQPLQGKTAARSRRRAALSRMYSPPPLICVRRSGATHSRPVLSAGIAAGVCRSGLSPPRTTLTWKWPSALPALPQPGSCLTASQPSLCTCCSIPEGPLSYPHSLILLSPGQVLPQTAQGESFQVPFTAWLCLHWPGRLLVPSSLRRLVFPAFRKGTTVGLPTLLMSTPLLFAAQQTTLAAK